MTKSVLTNLPASIKARLLSVSRERSEDFNLTLGRYAGERFLFRLSKSEHGERFILKGALLLTILMKDNPYRPTHDIDLLGELPGSVDQVRDAFESILATAVAPDGLQFVAESMRFTEIRQPSEFAVPLSWIWTHRKCLPIQLRRFLRRNSRRLSRWACSQAA
jgi:nucleotidyltransferase AbiEii toxin of type IV toxin-antitoxin system